MEFFRLCRFLNMKMNGFVWLFFVDFGREAKMKHEV